ncbi:MAG: hypothetical protein EON58_16120, partial [Alphaproteobacteria bacterium]
NSSGPQTATGQAGSPARDESALDGNDEAVLESLDAAMAEASDGFPEDEAFVMPKKRGRPKKRQRVVVAPEDLEIEQVLEAEVTHTIQDWQATFKDILESENHPLYKATGWTAQQMARAQLDQRDVPVNTSPDIGEDEFDDDPDVASCILGPEEVRIKERIWVTENEDWLRTPRQAQPYGEWRAPTRAPHPSACEETTSCRSREAHAVDHRWETSCKGHRAS